MQDQPTQEPVTDSTLNQDQIDVIKMTASSKTSERIRKAAQSNEVTPHA